MSRQHISEKELVDLINNRFREGDDLDGDCRNVEFSGFYRLVEPDELGCNWSPRSYSDPGGCEAVVATVIADFQKRYNLSDEVSD